MKKLNHRGFSAIEIVLVILALIVIGGTCYTVWHMRQEKSASKEASSSSLVTKTYNQNSITFNYSYPSNFTVSQDEGTVQLDSPNYDTQGDGAYQIITGESISITPTDREGFDAQDKKVQLTPENYLAVSFVNSSVSDAKNVQTGTKQGIKTLSYDYRGTRNTIFFLGNGKRIEVRLSYHEGDLVSEHDAAYNQIVDSIKL